MNMWYRGSLRSIPLHKATQKGDDVEVAALLAQVSTIHTDQLLQPTQAPLQLYESACTSATHGQACSMIENAGCRRECT